jgi:guanylate kinase
MGCSGGKTRTKNDLKQKVLVIVGPSGVGKGTLISKIKKEFSDKFAFKISHTTRYIRDGEVEGINYYYVSREVFERVNNIFKLDAKI